MSTPVIIPAPYALSPYTHASGGVDNCWERIVGVSAANQIMEGAFPSNLLQSQATITDPVTFEVLPDDEPEKGAFLRSAASMQQNLARTIKHTLTQSNKILVLGGDHTISIGTGLGLSQSLDMSKVGLIWVDAHADCNTPQTSLSKSITGYPVAVCGGLGPTVLTKGFNENVLKNIFYVGLRDIDQEELTNIQTLGAKVYSSLDVECGGVQAIAQDILSQTKDLDYLWLSIDIDSLDPVYFATDETDVPVTGGLTPRELLALTSLIEASGKLLITELVQLNDLLTSTDLTVLSSRIGERALGLGEFRYGS